MFAKLKILNQIHLRQVLNQSNDVIQFGNLSRFLNNLNRTSSSAKVATTSFNYSSHAKPENAVAGKLKQEEDLVNKYKELSNKIRNELDESKKLNEYCKQLFDKIETLCEEVKELQDLLNTETEDEMKKLLEEDLNVLNVNFEKLKDELIKLLYIESYLTDELTMEFENGVGGNESMMFVKELVDFYTQYCKKQDWNVEVVDVQESNDVDGYLKCTLQVAGKDCYKLMRHEAGVHRVQRVPSNDKMNRMHTSTVAIKVVPIFKDFEVDLCSKDLEFETIRSTGPGGQLVNKRESAVRLVHLPTNIAVRCEESRQQGDNKRAAIEKLRIKLSEIKFREIQEQEEKIRSQQVRSVMRSEKIRTFNFQQDRITDHRIKKDISNLKGFFAGTCNHQLTDWVMEMEHLHNSRLKEQVIGKFK